MEGMQTRTVIVMMVGTRKDTTTDPAHRSAFRIVADVLRAARSTDTKSRIFRRANLNHTRGERYLTFCDAAGLLEVEDGVRVTEEGLGYLSDWTHLEQYLDPLHETLDPP